MRQREYIGSKRTGYAFRADKAGYAEFIYCDRCKCWIIIPGFAIRHPSGAEVCRRCNMQLATERERHLASERVAHIGRLVGLHEEAWIESLDPLNT